MYAHFLLFFIEFARAFDETIGKDGQLPVTRVMDVLKRVFRGDVPAPEKKMQGKVIEDVEKGYYLND